MVVECTICTLSVTFQTLRNSGRRDVTYIELGIDGCEAKRLVYEILLIRHIIRHCLTFLQQNY